MPILQRKMLRDLWKIRWRALAVVLTVASGVGVYAGIEMAIATALHTRDVLLDRMRFADLEVQFLPEDVDNLPDLTGVPGVRAVERRLVLPGTVSLADQSRMNGVLVFLETPNPTLDALEIVDGGPVRPGDFESAVIERSLAQFHRFRVGDRIEVRVGEKTYASRIDGVAVSPEYLITTANPAYLVPEKGSVGVVFTNLARVSDVLGFTMVNDLLFRFDPEADPRVVRDAVVTQLGRLNLERVIPREEHFIWRHLRFAVDGFRVYVPSIVLTLGVLSLVLTVMTMNRLVRDQRREIGALLALGYGARAVFRAYLRSGALLGAAGGALGAAASFAFRDLFAKTYAHAIGLPEVLPVVLPSALAIGCVAAITGTAAATVLPVAQILRLTPQAIIREPIGGGGAGARWIQGILAPMSVLPLPIRFGVRNMIRRPGRTLSTILAIAFSLGVAIAYIVSLTSALQTTALVVERERWDLAVDFLHPVPLEDLGRIRSLSGTASVEPYFRRFAEVGVAGRYAVAGLLGIEPHSGMKRTPMKAGRFLSGQADEVLVSLDLARRLGIRVADRITVRIRSGREFVFHVVGISGELVPAQIMMSFRQAQEITEFPDAATGVFVATSGPTEPLTAALDGIDYVAKVTSKTGLAAAFQKMMSEMLGLVYVASGVSVFVAMLFIVMSVNVVISERQVEYATFKCLGYGRGRLNTTILAQAFGEGALAALVSIPLGLGLAVYLNARMSHAWYEVINIVRPGDVAQILAFAFVLIPVSSYPGLRVLDRLDIVKALRSRTIE